MLESSRLGDGGMAWSPTGPAMPPGCVVVASEPVEWTHSERLQTGTLFLPTVFRRDEPGAWPVDLRCGRPFQPRDRSRYAPQFVVVNELFAGAGPAVDVVEETDGFAVGVIDQVALLRTRKPMETASLDALFRATTHLMQEYGPRVLYVVIPGARRPSVDPDVARRVAEVWPRVQAQSSAGVMWVRNGGFAGALNRTQLSQLLPHLRDRSLLGVTVSAWETAEFFLNHAADLEIDPRDWAHAFEQFAALYD